MSAGEFRDDQGRLHREDGPARIYPSGRAEWYRHGRLHREDGPAVEHANGSEHEQGAGGEDREHSECLEEGRQELGRLERQLRRWLQGGQRKGGRKSGKSS